MPRPTFPKGLREFRQKCSSDANCWDYLSQSRWPEGFRCPKCAYSDSWWILSRHAHECQQCGHQTSVSAGTLLHRSHLPIQDWFWAAYLVATLTPGMSAKQLQRQLGCSYQTAWFVLHRLRRGMVSDTRSRLAGRVEADEVIVGGPVRGKRGRGVTKAVHSTLVFGAVEVIAYTDKHGAEMEKAGRLRLALTQQADAVSIRNFLQKSVAPGSEVYTDGWRGYSKAALEGYEHGLHPSGTHALHIHRAFGNLKTWLNGTHHGVDPKYLQSYLDEFAFRFNRRKTPLAGFQTLLGIASNKNPVSLRVLSQPASTG
jgi:transposase-like protein/Zn ribbon nucleic-acid-binding protein